jgi:ribosomal protein L9
MSKILRRPMFRGGPVDSRGTGITSGLMDGGRVGYQSGDIVLGGDLYKPTDFNKFIESYKPNMSPALVNDLFDRKTGQLKSGMTYENIFEAKDEEGKPISVFDADIFDFSKVGLEGDKSDRVGAKMIGKDDFADALKTDVLSKLKESKAYEPEFRGGGVDAAQEDFGKEKLDVDNDTTGNNTSNVEISAKDLIRENAELFKELLGEGQKEKIKKARIGDASDYLLKFFEGSQKEGATVGSAAADVAGFATSRDSRTEKARAANEKIDQTATVLAINDYISGKRSKEDIMKALSLAKAKVSLTEGTLGDKILKAKGSGPVTVTVIRDVLRSEPEFSGKSVEEFDSTKADLAYSEGDENKIFIDVITKETFTFDENKNKVRIY